MQSLNNQRRGKILILINFILTLYLLLPAQGNSQDSRDTTIINSTDFLHHFNKLNIAVKTNLKDTLYYCCSGSILYMEFATKISAKADGTFLGKLFFTKSEFARWRIWGIRKGWIKR
jgi:hypothetical protein